MHLDINQSTRVPGVALAVPQCPSSVGLQAFFGFCPLSGRVSKGPACLSWSSLELLFYFCLAAVDFSPTECQQGAGVTPGALP